MYAGVAVATIRDGQRPLHRGRMRTRPRALRRHHAGRRETAIERPPETVSTPVDAEAAGTGLRIWCRDRLQRSQEAIRTAPVIILLPAHGGLPQAA